MFRYILFDLDGTLTDPKEGICKSVQYALGKMGIQEPNIDKLEPFIGPPLMDSFMNFYGMDKKEAQKAVDFYRERFSAIGIYENKIYPGIPELLDTLKDKGAFLAIASSKPTVFVEKILKYFKIDSYFDVVVGAELNGVRGKKEEVVEEALKQLRELDDLAVHAEDGFGVLQDGTPNPNRTYKAILDASNTAMVGDRMFDIQGALAFDVYPVGVNYGYAPKGELKEAGALSIAENVKQLHKVLINKDGKQNFDALAKAKRIQQKSKNQNSSLSGVKKSEKSTTEPNAPILDALVYKKELSNYSIMRAVYMALPLFMFWAIRYGIYYLIYLFVLNPYIYEPLEQGQVSPLLSQISLANLDGIINLVITLATGLILFLFYRKKEPVGKFNQSPKSVYLVIGFAGLLLSRGLNIIFEMVCNKIPSLAVYYEKASYSGHMGFWLGFVVYVLLTPLVEEMAFRWLFYGRTRRVLGRNLAIICSSIVFGIYHGNLVQGIYAFIMGLCLTLVYEKTGNILSSMIFHGMANAIIFGLAYLPSSVQKAASSILVMVLCMLAGIGAMVFVLRSRNKVKSI